jgi:hypothetical protein
MSGTEMGGSGLSSEVMPLSFGKKVIFLTVIAAVAFTLGLFVARTSVAAEGSTGGALSKPAPIASPKVIYPKNAKVDLDGMSLQGEVRNPGEFYFQRRPEEKFDSLVKRRKNFHKEMLRDVVISK